MEKTYELGTTTYVQRPLVLGQIRQLLEQLEGLTFDAAAGPAVLVATLGDRLPLCLAVVLTPEGASPREKDLVALADEIEFAIAPEQVLEVVEDFFDCNPLASLLERAAGMLRSLTARVGVEVKPAATAGAPGSTTSSSSSPAATSPGETGSSGASPSPSASPGSSTGAET